jgi:uncharacterized membrane protein
MAALTYLLMPLTSILIYFGEKEDDYVRFHARQSAVVGAVLLVLWTMLGLIDALIIAFFGWHTIPLIVVVAVSLAPLAVTLLLWVFLMYKAYGGERFKLPYAGEVAERKTSEPAKNAG